MPGNVDLDLSRPGLLPEDLFFGENILAVQAWEDVEWWYATSFSLGAEELDKQLELVFHAVDGDAEYYVNGRPSAPRPTRSSSTRRDQLCGPAGHNDLVVYLRPPRPPAEASELVPCGRSRIRSATTASGCASRLMLTAGTSCLAPCQRGSGGRWNW